MSNPVMIPDEDGVGWLPNEVVHVPAGLLHEAADTITRLTAENERLRAALQWQPIETAPRDGSRMLLAYRNALQKWRRVIAFYAPKFSVEQNGDCDGWAEYDEANDRYCLPEGWYECIENWDDYSSVHMCGVEPTHWLPLPPPPVQESNDE